MKIITIDGGNTSLKVGFFENDQLLKVVRLDNESLVMNEIKRFSPIGVIMSDVGSFGKSLIEALKKGEWHFELFDNQSRVPLNNLYKTPQTLGADRLAAVVGAMVKYPDQNCLVIDIGTCITYDYLDKEANYHGGIIAPGLNMRLKSMHQFTTNLPDLETGESMPVLIGTSTESCMLSGAWQGMKAEIDGVIDSFKQDKGKFTTIICGGDAKNFESYLKESIFADLNLVMFGLHQIIRTNILSR